MLDEIPRNRICFKPNHMSAQAAKKNAELGQWVTSAEADSISFRPVSLGRKLNSLAQQDFNSFKMKLSMA